MNNSGFLQIYNKYKNQLKLNCGYLYTNIRKIIEDQLNDFIKICTIDIQKQNVEDTSFSTDNVNMNIDSIIIKNIHFTLKRNANQSVQDFVKITFTKMFGNGIIPQNEIRNLYDRDYCKQKFKIEYALIVDEQAKTIDKSGRARYWTSSKIGGHYMCSQWWKQYFPQYECALADYIKYIARLNE